MTSSATAAAAVPFILFAEGYRQAPRADLPHHRGFARLDELPGLVASLAPAASERRVAPA